MRLLAVIVTGSAAVSILAGCAGGSGSSSTGGAVLLAPDRPPELAASRSVTGNPPQRDLISATGDGRGVEVLGPPDSGKGPLSVSSPAWSPDGSRIAFVASDDPTGFQSDVYVASAGGSSPERLTDDGSFEPVWAPNGTAIAFARWTPSPTPESPLAGSTLWIMSSDGSDLRALTDPQDGAYDRPGSFSPDGDTFVFTRSTSPFGDAASSAVYALDLASSETRKLADDGVDPAYAPDGKLIAFGSSRDNNGDYQFGEDEVGPSYELYVMGADGSDQRRLTRTHGINEFAPSWSSDGAQLAYESQGSSYAKAIYTMNPDGSCAKPILDGGRRTWYSEPAWRPGSKPGALRCR